MEAIYSTKVIYKDSEWTFAASFVAKVIANSCKM